MKKLTPLQASKYAAVALATLTLNSGCDRNERQPFSFELNPQLLPSSSMLPDADGNFVRPVGSYADSNGIQTDFVTNEVIFTPRNGAELVDFLVETNGVVMGDDAVPPPPANLPGTRFQPQDGIAQSYTIQINTLPAFSSVLEAGKNRGMSGNYQFTNEAAAQLIAFSAAQVAQGRELSPNWVYSGQAMLHSSADMPDGSGGNVDSMGYFAFQGPIAGNSNRSTVYGAWQFMVTKGFAPQSVNLAVIDGGFWLDTEGHPMTPANSIGTDFPYNIAQYDFVGDDTIADGVNPTKCSGGSTCNWHGNGSASTAGGFLNNGGSAAGTGGQVANLVLFKTDLSFAQVRRAARTLAPWGIKVANMSFSGNCNEDCREYRDDNNYYTRFQEAYDAGVVMVAAAGNANVDVDANHVEPCLINGVICVGALNPYDYTRVSYSNFGAGVDIWAPTNIPANPDGDDPTQLKVHNGTSASAPFIAGIAAMIKAVNPALNGDQVRNILWETAFNVGAFRSTDLNVQNHGYVNAVAALRKAANNVLPDDGFEPNNNPSTARSIAPGTLNELILNPGNWDYFNFTVNDYSQVNIQVEYMKGLGPVSAVIKNTAVDGAIPSGVAPSATATGLTYSGSMAPGVYQILLSSQGALNYNLTLSVSPTGLFPDVFEVNNTFGTAREVIEVNELVNLHNDLDVDYYYFNIPTEANGVSYYYYAGIIGSDIPVNIELFDNSAVLLDSTVDQEWDYNFGSMEAGNLYRLKVSGLRSRYNLVTGLRAKAPPTFVPYDPWAWMNPIGPDPFTGIFRGPEEWIEITAIGRESQLNLVGDGLDFALYDSSGQLLAESSKLIQQGSTQLFGRTLNVEGRLGQGQKAYLKIFRGSLGQTALGDVGTIDVGNSPQRFTLQAL